MGVASPRSRRPGRDLEAVPAGHHHIQDREVEPAALQVRVGCIAVARPLHDVSLFTQNPAHEGAQRCIVLGEQDAHAP